MAKSRLLSHDDYWSIWIGSTLLILALFLFFTNSPKELNEKHTAFNSILKIEEDKGAPFKTINWYQTFDQQKKLKASSEPIGKFLKNFTGKPGSWKSNPFKSLLTSQATVDQKAKQYTEQLEASKATLAASLSSARSSQSSAASSNYTDEQLNTQAEASIEQWRSDLDKMNAIAKKQSVKKSNKLGWLIGLMLFLCCLFGFGSSVMGTPFIKFAKGFFYVFFIGIIAYMLGAQSDMKAIGFGYAAWAILIGLLISNTVGTPSWVKPALSTEFYIKTGLVILGAEILLSKILAIGLPGIFVAWVVTPIVLVSTYWFGQKVLKIGSKTLNMTISADMSVCGVSAAVATAAACKASKEELTVAIGLSMMFTSVMMIVMPAFINYMDMPEVLGGAWLGGTIDATGAVVAAGAFLGETALSVAATIKMIQNVLIGIIAFGVAFYFATKVDQKEGTTQEIGWSEIWKRFPKFILGFLGASIVFSLIYTSLGENEAYTMIDQGVIGGFTKNVRGWLFCLAFVSIGLSINFKELRKHFVGGKPLILYLCGQTFNLCFTLLMAYIMFYLVFPQITSNI